MREFVTVEWLTEISIFKNKVKLLAGKGGIDRLVTYVTVQEAPDFYKQIEGGEFVLSTWYAFYCDEEAGLAALRNLSGTASGLCIKINRFLYRIPESFIKYANEANFPLFIVDKDVKFREIIKAITIEINMSYVNVLIQLNDYYKYLFQTALENGSADSILLDFSKRYGLIAITISADLRQIRGMHSFQKLRNYENRLQMIKQIISSNSNRVEYFSENEYRVFPCIARGYCYGYLIVLSVNELTERQHLCVTQLVNIITIKWLDRQEKKNDTLLSMLDMIMHSSEKDGEYICQLLSRNSIDVSSGVRAICVKYEHKKGNSHMDLSIVQKFLVDLTAISPNLLYIWDKASDAFMLLMDGQHSENVVEDLSYGFLYNVVKTAENYKSISVAIGPVVDVVNDIRVSIKMAINSFLFKNKGGANVVYYKDNLMQFALLSGANSRECDLFLEETIMPIAKHDRHERDCIIQMLASVYENTSLEEAAKKENIHVNSIRYRLQKIKNICGLDFFIQAEKYIILTAYMLYAHREKYRY